MKRSSAISLVLVTSAAASLTACRQQKATRYCVDANNVVVEDRNCAPDAAADHRTTDHWYYGGAHGSVPLGTRVNGGSTTEPAEGFTTPEASGTARGVLGEAGESASGRGGESGGGEGGAHGGGEGGAHGGAGE